MMLYVSTGAVAGMESFIPNFGFEKAYPFCIGGE